MTTLNNPITNPILSQSPQKPKNFIIVGSGGREHAIARAIKRSQNHPNLNIHVLGSHINPAMLALSSSYQVVDFSSPTFLIDLYDAGYFDNSLVIFGPEVPLANAWADFCINHSIPTIGPSREYAQIEVSKAFARQLMSSDSFNILQPFIPQTITVQNPQPKMFTREKVIEDLKTHQIVIKPNGLTGGKGVKIFNISSPESWEPAKEYANEILTAHPAQPLHIEEYLDGYEFSLMSWCDGKSISHMPPVMDHKKLLEGDLGPNTGGMGSIMLANHNLPFLPPDILKTAQTINTRIIEILQERNILAANSTSDSDSETTDEFEAPQPFPYIGVLFGGFMYNPATNRLNVLEFNCRLGDPEAINILESLSTDFVDLAYSLINQRLSDNPPIQYHPHHTVCKYVVPQGYGSPQVSKTDTLNLSNLSTQIINNHIIMASITDDDLNPQNLTTGSCFQLSQLHMLGSRALAVVASGNDYQSLLTQIDDIIDQIQGTYSSRRDIGYRLIQDATNFPQHLPNPAINYLWTPDPAAYQSPPASCYAQAGVNLKMADRCSAQISKIIKSANSSIPKNKDLFDITHRSNSFAGMAKFKLINVTNECYSFEPEKHHLISTMDGLGTKPEVLFKLMPRTEAMKILGHDLVIANLNDLICQGLEVKPLFFLDYYGCGKLIDWEFTAFIEALSKTCSTNNIKVLGGETAEMKPLGPLREFVGCMTGMVSSNCLFPNPVNYQSENFGEGDIVIGLNSLGLHTNGYSLVLKLVEEGKILPAHLSDDPEFVNALCQPHFNYYPIIQCLKTLQYSDLIVLGYAHITGGGLDHNINRVIPDHLKVKWGLPQLPSVFQKLQELGQIPNHELRQIYNCGVGFVVICKKSCAIDLTKKLNRAYLELYPNNSPNPSFAQIVGHLSDQ